MTLTREQIHRRCQQRLESHNHQITTVLQDDCHTRLITCGPMPGPMYETIAITAVVRLTQAQR